MVLTVLLIAVLLSLTVVVKAEILLSASRLLLATVVSIADLFAETVPLRLLILVSASVLLSLTVLVRLLTVVLVASMRLLVAVSFVVMVLFSSDLAVARALAASVLFAAIVESVVFLLLSTFVFKAL